MFAVYRILKNGSHKYVSRSVTHSEKLAREIARDLSDGICVMPDGSTRKIRAYPHIAKAIAENQKQGEG